MTEDFSVSNFFFEGGPLDAMRESTSTVRAESPHRSRLGSVMLSAMSYPETLCAATESRPSSPQYAISNSNGTRTSDTSWEQDIAPPDSFAEVLWPVPLEEDGSTLRGIGGGNDPEQPIPQSIPMDLWEDIELGMSPTQVGDDPDINARALMVLPTRETQAGVSHQRKWVHDLAQHLGQVLSHIDASFALIPPPSTSNPDGLLQIRQGLGHLRQCFGHLTDQINALGRDAGPFQPTTSVPPSDVGPIEKPRENFQCCICREHFQGIYSLKRHVNDRHHPEREYRCGHKGCEYTHRRRDKFMNHFLSKKSHNRRLSRMEAEQYAYQFPCPPICSICYLNVDSWREFYDCFTSHCPRQDTSRQASGSSLNHRAGLMAPPMHRLLSNNQAGGIADPLHPGVEAPHDPSNSRQPKHGDPLRARLLRRQARRSRGTPIQRPSCPRRESQPGCERCKHLFRDCKYCCRLSVSTPSCHECLGNEAVLANSRVQPGPSLSGVPLEQDLDYPSTINPSYFDLGYQPELDIGAAQIMQGQQPSGNGFYGGPQRQGWSLNRMPAALTGTIGAPFRSNHRAMAVTSLEEPVLDEYDMEFPRVLRSKVALAPDTLISILPLMDPFKRWVSRPLQGVGGLALSGLDLITKTDQTPPTITKAGPVVECQCTCRGRARAALAAGRRVELDFKLLPEYRGTSHLRTRVQLVVKLLKLRSSAAKSTNKRMKEAKVAIEKAFESTFVDTSPERPGDDFDDSDDSDAESVFDEDSLSIASSCSDILALSPPRPGSPVGSGFSSLDKPTKPFEPDEKDEEEINVKFDFDLHSALSKMSKWTGGSSGYGYHDLSTSDSRRVLEYFVAYVLYVMMSLARSRDHISGSDLDN